MMTDVQVRALKDVRSNLLGEIEGAAKQLRDHKVRAERGDYVLGNPAALKRAQERHAAAVETLEAFDREHGQL